jgi:hypothetical protein
LAAAAVGARKGGSTLGTAGRASSSNAAADVEIVRRRRGYDAVMGARLSEERCSQNAGS